MRKVTIVFLSMLLVLIIGQAAFAKGSIGLTAGYGKGFDGAFPGGLMLKLSGDCYFTNNFSLAAVVSADLFFVGKVYLFDIDVSLFARYDLLKTNVSTVGLQFGAMSLFTIGSGDVLLYAGPGIYANFNVAPKFSIYADAKLPVGVIAIGGSGLDFVPLYIYNLTLGAGYLVTPSVNLGVELNFNNNFILLNRFSVGAKLSYVF